MKKAKGNEDKHFTVHESTELLPFLLHVLNKSRNSVKSMLGRGQIAIDGDPVTAFNAQLQNGQVVTVSNRTITKQDEWAGLKILHEDDHIIVIDKASGLLSIASDKEKSATAHRQLMEHVKKTHKNNRVFIVHRLDRDTSGVMVFAKSEKVKNMLQDNWKEVVSKRTYVALVEGRVKHEQGTITSWMKETKTHLMYSVKEGQGGKYAETHYKTLQANRRFSLLELQLKTGRKNQIRVHMKDLGHPIVGDKKYGASTNEIGRLGLHAKELAFTHPITGKTISYQSDIPTVFKSRIDV
ncbi:RNA pseudouridylate synthase [Pontibacillus halophilus JSM 076056 = DSM 19796]|uniref:Pseudouridine synthase n=1 Tax=Pontibacillus halophilus JSM 076056 = DSM 19796 TaxID=1385510 RepID=A0A0A5GGH6_9BACI|nr:RluA family pseudouridine synthase [Pontibacillus halophilus]KGX91084.1 RNA pseudouridylate synthase [Pontibacillus halophilus JSM 076056 = DSM 19796]